MGKRLQKMVVFIAFIAFVSMATNSHAEESGQCKDWVAKVAAVVGKIDAKRHGEQQWIPVKRNNTYCAGDQIRAAKASKATLVFSNETLVTLDEHTAITINQIDNDGPSLIELVKGIAHFISRVPRSLKVNTPFVNAAIEGTEFVVEVGDNETNVTVFEGTVLTSNEQGELRVTNNETSKTLKGEAPQKILMAHPRDAVQWAIYFPPVAKGEIHDEQSAKSKAHRAITAIVNNQDNALALAKEAVELSPDAAASHIALSYAWQSKFDLDKAIASAKTATEKEPDNAIARARLAEMQLSIGELSKALDSAQKASELDTNNARAQTILGYAYLTQIKISKARETFNNAIELDQSDPLPHLGLGLAMIRKNELSAGRREIEIAAALDPNNSIIRSYLGKAYYEEKRGPLDADQFEMAKALDPNDPTPYFYDAIRKQTGNDPVGALKDINKSIELNDNRAVYRSSLQLDQDEAARNTGLAKIYNDISFNQLSLLEGADSVTNDPLNHSGHRFLADSYAELPRHEIAQVSQLLQAKMFAPFITSPVQLLYTQPELPIQTGNARLKQAVNENSSLFISNGLKFNGDVILGSNDTIGENISVSGVYDKFSFSIGQLKYKTDGYRINNDQDHELLNLLTQYNFTPNTSIQLELLSRESEYGDIESRFDLTNINESDRFKFDKDTARVGLKHAIDNNSTILLSYIDSKENNSRVVSDITVAPPVETTVDTTTISELDGNTTEAQYLFISPHQKLVVGASVFDQKDLSIIDGVVNITVAGTPLPPTIIPTTSVDKKIEHTNYYLYNYFNITQSLLITLGLSYDDFKDTDINSTQDISTNKVSPKFGLEWDISRNSKFRLASFNTFKRPLLSNQTLEPTQIAGFNQFFDDINAGETNRYGAGIDFKHSSTVFSGIEFTERKIQITELAGSKRNQKEIMHRIYFYWTPSSSTALSAEYSYDQYSTDFDETDVPNYLKTHSLPIRISYFWGSIYTSLTATYVNQYQQSPQSGTFLSDNDEFTTTDIEIGYKFKSKVGHIGIYINNIFDEQFKYRDRNFQFTADHISKFIPERTVFLNANLNF